MYYIWRSPSLWRHHPPQQQHEGWRAANKWSDGNENSLYRKYSKYSEWYTLVQRYTTHTLHCTIYMRATTIFTVSTGDMY